MSETTQPTERKYALAEELETGADALKLARVAAWYFMRRVAEDKNFRDAAGYGTELFSKMAQAIAVIEGRTVDQVVGEVMAMAERLNHIRRHGH